MVAIRIYTCPEWGAVPPKQGITTCGKAARTIFHHTASHHREITPPASDSVEEAMQYARDIQAFHMRPVSQGGKGWIDSGHNFLVTRGGHILQGRWLTVSAVEARHMVISAHCPGQNDQIGIEHEHKGTEPMTPEQRHASARLMAWLAAQYGRTLVLPSYPHSKYVATACPANLKAEIVTIKSLAQQILAEEG